MLGILYSIIAGVSMSLQGVFNTRLSEKIGLWLTNAIVQGVGFIITLIIVLLINHESLANLNRCKKLYFLGGVLGVIIIITVMQGIKLLGVTHSIAIILTAQLLAAAVIDFFGLFDSPKINFTLNKIVGIAVMIVGIIILKWKG
ncbi:DMT family transporter [Clostridium sp. WILCCON 0269]|uniref:DMT family transporter n=1 Tax=Candidatus Clostridium eludens TaxID=3381663 RepID=A0ABW8SJV5_9CLOT